MRALLTPQPSLSFSSININFPNPNPCRARTSLHFLMRDGGFRLIGRKSRFTATRAVLDAAIIEQLGLKESDIRNPAVSSTYRSFKLPKPNQTVLEAQARVCTGPTQTKPLSEEQAFKVLDTILRSGQIFVTPFISYKYNFFFHY